MFFLFVKGWLISPFLAAGVPFGQGTGLINGLNGGCYIVATKKTIEVVYQFITNYSICILFFNKILLFHLSLALPRTLSGLSIHQAAAVDRDQPYNGVPPRQEHCLYIYMYVYESI